MLDKLVMLARYAAGLRSFLARPLTPSGCREMLRRLLDTREQSFLTLLERGVFSHARSPYRAR